MDLRYFTGSAERTRGSYLRVCSSIRETVLRGIDETISRTIIPQEARKVTIYYDVWRVTNEARNNVIIKLVEST